MQLNLVANALFLYLKSLKSPIHIYYATVDGEFERQWYPADEKLQVAREAQVMLLNNDSFITINCPFIILIHLPWAMPRIEASNHPLHYPQCQMEDDYAGSQAVWLTAGSKHHERIYKKFCRHHCILQQVKALVILQSI